MSCHNIPMRLRASAYFFLRHAPHMSHGRHVVLLFRFENFQPQANSLWKLFIYLKRQGLLQNWNGFCCVFEKRDMVCHRSAGVA